MNKEILENSINKALQGGKAGFIAMTGNVVSMMWLRTIVNYQYRNGGTFNNTIKVLYKEGGIPRFYKGVSFALLNAPLSRFGDTAMNTFVNSSLKDTNLNTATKTFIGSCGAGLWRIFIIPIDTFKSSLQVNGSNGINIIRERIKMDGLKTLYNGSMASGFSTMVGHFPWFFTYNYLNETFPKENYNNSLEIVCRSALIGFSSSSCSDIISNSLRVIKVNKQVSNKNDSYKKVINDIITKDKISGLMTRGLTSKIITNGIQGMVFTVLFDFFKNY